MINQTWRIWNPILSQVFHGKWIRFFFFNYSMLTTSDYIKILFSPLCFKGEINHVAQIICQSSLPSLSSRKNHWGKFFCQASRFSSNEVASTHYKQSKNQVITTPTQSNASIAHAEKILLDCFNASTLAGDQREIHNRLARILPPGAYFLCNLIRGTEATTPGQQINTTPRGQHSRHRRSPYGAHRRSNPPILMAYLSAAEREEFQLLEEEKSKQFQARSLARETKNNIEQAERRLATIARLNLQQAELDAKKTALLHSNRPVQFPPNTSNPASHTPGPSNTSIDSPLPNSRDGRESSSR